MIPHANGQKLRVSVKKYLDMAYEMIDLNTLSVVMLSYDSDMNEIILKLQLSCQDYNSVCTLQKNIDL